MALGPGIRARVDSRRSKWLVAVWLITVEYPTTDAHPVLPLGRHAESPRLRRGRSPRRDGRRRPRRRRPAPGAPADAAAGLPGREGENARAAGPPRPAPPSAPAAARALRPRLEPRGHQEAAGRDRPAGAPGDAPARAGGPRPAAPRADARPAAARSRRQDPRPPEVRLRRSRGEAEVRGAAELAPPADAPAVLRPDGEVASGHDARGPQAPARDDPGLEPHAPRAGRRA